MKAPEEVLEMINHRCNCVLRHNICNAKQFHTGGTGGQDTFDKCLAQIVYFEGPEAVEEYLKFMTQQTQLAGKMALNRFKTFMTEHPKYVEGLVGTR